ncbi:MAG: NAD(P)/FAD-dependent oxidoreductase, partial [Chitinophagales bacterium]
DHTITVISGETAHFYSRTALMYIYMGHMRYQDTKPYADSFWEKNKINLIHAWVKSVDAENKQVIFENDSHLRYDKLLIACGSKSNKFGWPGQDLKGVQTLYNYQDLELLTENTKNGIHRAVIVGGGLIGIELAEMLHARKYPVTLLVRESNYWNNVLPEQEAKLVSRHIKEHGFDLRLNTELKEIIDDGTGRVKAVKTKNNEIIECQLVGLTAGVSPNIDWIKNSPIKTERGVIINRHMTTNFKDVFAAGDCAQFQHAFPHTNALKDRRVIEQVWYTGKLQGETAALNMLGYPTLYHPGYWFNSAKFLDIEYQTYGTVMPQLREGEAEFYWEHSDGKKCIHFIFNKTNRQFIGVNVFGIRLRHELFNIWLKENKSIDYVLQHLKAANFNPEFFAPFEQQVIDKWNRENPSNSITLKPKNILNNIIFR